MRTILTLSVVVVLTVACAPRPHPYPVGQAPYLLHVPAPGTDYRYRGGPQGFGRTGPVHHAPMPYSHSQAPYSQPPYSQPPHGHPGLGHGQPLSPEHPYGAWGEPHAYGRGDGYAWSDRRESVRGGHAYESREMMTEETWIGGGVILEREGPREPHRVGPNPYEAAPGYPGPYAEAPRRPEPEPEPEPYRPAPRPPYPDQGPEPFY